MYVEPATRDLRLVATDPLRTSWRIPGPVDTYDFEVSDERVVVFVAAENEIRRVEGDFDGPFSTRVVGAGLEVDLALSRTREDVIWFDDGWVLSTEGSVPTPLGVALSEPRDVSSLAVVHTASRRWFVWEENGLLPGDRDVRAYTF